MKILALEVENIKFLKVVSIKPDGSLVIIGGDNAAGKSCVLDSIWYALGGGKSAPPKPIRKGQKKGKIVLDLGDIKVTRTFTKAGTNLVVENKKGVKFGSPQAMLDKLVGELTFDPLEFSKMDAKKQAEVLKQLVGLDFNKLDVQHKKLFEERTAINRRGKEVRANLDALTLHEGMSDKEVSVAELSKQYTKATEDNRFFTLGQTDLADDITEIDKLKKRLTELKKNVKERQKSLEGKELIDTKLLQEKMNSAESTNTKIRENQKHAVVKKDIDKLLKQSGSLTSQLTEIEATKEKTLAKAKFPIEGLAIDDDGVTFEDIPFTQCSSAQQIKISVAMGLAMNPKLRVLLIREGSLLDTKSLQMVSEMAEKADAQIWCERVSKGSECQVILEDVALVEEEEDD